MIGGSAGGGIALSVTDRLVREGKRDIIQGAVAMNPITCHWSNPPEKYKEMYKSYDEFATGAPVIDLHCMRMSFCE